MRYNPAFFQLIAACLLLTSAPALAADFDDAPSDSRIRLLHYSESAIYTITTRVGYQTNVEFDKQEEISTISIGERSFWQIIPAGNRLFIRPLESNVATNMTIITNRRSYQFDLKSVGAKGGSDITYVARFSYPSAHPRTLSPPDALPAPPPQHVLVAPPGAAYTAPAPVALTPPPAMLAQSGPAPKRNYLYTYSGPDGSAPYEVFDDGSATYIRYEAMTRALPAISRVEKDGSETPLNPYLKDGYIAVDAVAPKLAVRSGGDTVFVYNDMLAPPSQN
jgi:type IV secretion system protein VirB9